MTDFDFMIHFNGEISMCVINVSYFKSREEYVASVKDFKDTA